MKGRRAGSGDNCVHLGVSFNLTADNEDFPKKKGGGSSKATSFKGQFYGSESGGVARGGGVFAEGRWR